MKNIFYFLLLCVFFTRNVMANDEILGSRNFEESSERLKERNCSAGWAWIVPGLTQICYNKPGEGLSLLGLSAAELTGGILASRSKKTGDLGANLILYSTMQVPMYSIGDGFVDRARSKNLPFTPSENLGELALAPFRWKVIQSPYVWGSLLFDTGLSYLLYYAIGANNENHTSQKLNDYGEAGTFYGWNVGEEAADALHFGNSMFGAIHPAIAEETLFRGALQSGLARTSIGEWGALATQGLLFGAVHIPNFDLKNHPRGSIAGLTSITLGGGFGYGLMYKQKNYQLSYSVATHFWWDTFAFFMNYLENRTIGTPRVFQTNWQFKF